MSSQRKIEANRKNAEKSTGPKTEDGKRASSMNAFVHGLRCRDAVIPQLGETDEDYRAFCDAFHNEYRPSTPTQMALVQDLGRMFYRLQRFSRIEAGNLDSTIDFISKGNNDYNRFNSKRDADRAAGDAAGYSNHTMPILESNSRQEQRLRNSIFKTINTILALQKINPPAPPSPPENDPVTNEANEESPVESTTRLQLVPSPLSTTPLQAPAAVPEVAAIDLDSVENVIK